MRKSASEKLQIVKEATSKKKIKKLSVKCGITTKTIRNWISQAAEGRLDEGKTKTHEKVIESTAVRKKPFRNIIYKAVKLDLPKKNCDCEELYRHIFRDKNCGFLFCSYSTRKDAALTGAMCGMFITQAAKAGYTVKEIITDRIPETEDLTEIMKDYGVKLVRENFSKIKKHTVFSQKKNSYVKERTKYEKCTDFIFDSLATVCRNNENITGNKKKIRKMLGTIKYINWFMHSAVMKKETFGIPENNVLQVLSSNLNAAIEFHKRYDLENADQIYEKLYYILKDSSIDKNLLIKVMTQRAKICGLKKSYNEAMDYVKRGLRLLKDETVVNRYKLMYSLYMLNADISRVQNDRNKTLYYMGKSGDLLEKINDPETSAVFRLNYGKVLNTYGMKNKAFDNYEQARVIAEKNSLISLKPAIEESFASAYSIVGQYEESKKIFKKMIRGDFYSDSPYFRALLLAKYADLLHLTGELGKSLIFYDRSLEIMLKHPEIDMFIHLALIIESNKAFTLVKMNKFNKANSIFIKNLKKAQDMNFSDLIPANIAYLISCENEHGRPKEAAKYIKDLGLLLKNVNNPEMECKYYLGMGELFMNKNDHVKAEENMLKAVSIAETPNLPPTSYFNSAFKLADIYAVTGKRTNSIKIADRIVKRAKKKNFSIFIFKGELVKKKAEYFMKNKTGQYIKYLNELKLNAVNDEIKYFIDREITRHSKN
ncbi:MAG: hypothetical protein AB7V07_07780 [Candidatus Delongbacteria bacterium]